MTTTYREIRLAHLDDALGFARERGSGVAPGQVRHELSLSAETEGEVAGYALCVEEDGRHVVELALTPAAAERGLAKPLADTALRKMQAAGLGTARVRALNDGASDRIWQASNWLDRIPCWGAADGDDAGHAPAADAGAPVGAGTPADEPAQAAQTA